MDSSQPPLLVSGYKAVLLLQVQGEHLLHGSFEKQGGQRASLEPIFFLSAFN